MRHITIQEISARYPIVYYFIAKWGRNNYQNIFLIDSDTEKWEFPDLYILSCGRLYEVVYTEEGDIVLKNLGACSKILEAVTIAREAVEHKHPYLSSSLENSEEILGLRSSNALI